MNIGKCDHLYQRCVLTQQHNLAANSPQGHNVQWTEKELHLKTLQASVSMLKVHGSTVRKKTDQEKASLKRKGRHNLGLHSCVWANHKASGIKSSGQMRPQFGQNAQHHIWQKPNKIYQHKHLIPYCQAQWWRGRLVTQSTESGHLAAIESTTNASVHQSI